MLGDCFYLFIYIIIFFLFWILNVRNTHGFARTNTNIIIVRPARAASTTTATDSKTNSNDINNKILCGSFFMCCVKIYVQTDTERSVKKKCYNFTYLKFPPSHQDQFVAILFSFNPSWIYERFVFLVFKFPLLRIFVD